MPVSNRYVAVTDAIILRLTNIMLGLLILVRTTKGIHYSIQMLMHKGSLQKKQALRNSCELLRQRKELHAPHDTACKLL